MQRVDEASADEQMRVCGNGKGQIMHNHRAPPLERTKGRRTHMDAPTASHDRRRLALSVAAAAPLKPLEPAATPPAGPPSLGLSVRMHSRPDAAIHILLPLPCHWDAHRPWAVAQLHPAPSTPPSMRHRPRLRCAPAAFGARGRRAAPFPRPASPPTAISEIL